MRCSQNCLNLCGVNDTANEMLFHLGAAETIFSNKKEKGQIWRRRTRERTQSKDDCACCASAWLLRGPLLPGDTKSARVAFGSLARGQIVLNLCATNGLFLWGRGPHLAVWSNSPLGWELSSRDGKNNICETFARMKVQKVHTRNFSCRSRTFAHIKTAAVTYVPTTAN